MDVVTPGALQSSSIVCLTAEENPREFQLRHHITYEGCATSHRLKCDPLPPYGVTRTAQPLMEKEGIHECPILSFWWKNEILESNSTEIIMASEFKTKEEKMTCVFYIKIYINCGFLIQSVYKTQKNYF